MKLCFKKPNNFRKMIMHNNAQSSSAKKTNEELNKMIFKDTNSMKLPVYSPYLNLTKNLWNILKRNVYISRWLFTNKQELWNAILDAVQSIT